MRIFKTILISLIILLAAPKVAHAEELLEVGMISYEGEKIITDHQSPVMTSTPVTFRLPGPVGNSYAVSIDGGENFGSFVPMEGDSLTLYPDEENAPGRVWTVKFKNTGEETEIFSENFSVCFDLTPPEIRFLDEEKISGWIKEKTDLHFQTSDEKGIGRVVVKCGNDVLYEMHSKNNSVIYEHSFSFSVSEGSSEVCVNCYDIAGNCSSLSFSCMNDQTSPRIRVDGIEDGSVLTGETPVYVRVYDNDDDAYIVCLCERRAGDEIITSEESYDGPLASIPFYEEGSYKVRLYACDNAGNTSDEETIHFALDTSPPVITIDGIPDGADLRKGLSAGVTVSDLLYDTTEVNISLTRTAMGNSEYIPIQSYKMLATNDTRMVNINSDGEYELQVFAKDAADNDAKSVKRFRIDTTAPDISVEGIDEGVAVRDPIIRFSVGEMFHESAIMTYTLEKRNRNDYSQVANESRVMKDVTDHMDIKCDSEGEFRLTCTASDRSGNTSEKMVRFTVDRTPPVISGVKDVDNRFLKSFSLPGKVTDLVSDLGLLAAGAYINDTPIKDTDVIIEEGKYVLSILAEDEAGNISEESACFIVDHTSPQIVLEGFDRNGNVKKGSYITVRLADESDTLTEVKFNGRNIVTAGNTAGIAIDDYGDFLLEVRAEDPAGNITDTQIHTLCASYGSAFTGFKAVERTISDVTKNDNDIDVKGLLIGLASVLSGTMGLTYRGVFRC